MTAHDDDDDVDDILRLPPGEKAHAAWVSQELREPYIEIPQTVDL